MATSHVANDRALPGNSRGHGAAVPDSEVNGPSNLGGEEPRTKLRNGVLAVAAISAIASAARDPQYAMVGLIPLPMLFATPRVATRVLLAAAAVLVVIGGGVTTYREGMAVPDYPTTFDHNMWTYPLGEMLAKGRGVTLEHVHRLWASGVGLVSICVVLVCIIHRARTALTAMAFATLVAISLQGLLGGTRVLENSQNLAFLHGALAQAVVAMIAVLAMTASRTWCRIEPRASEYASGAHFLGPFVAGLVYVQILLGAWLRHRGDTTALLVHGTLALAVVAMVLVFAKQLSVAATGVVAGPGEELGAREFERRPLQRFAHLLIGSLIAQFALGILATVGIYFVSGGMTAEVSVGEAVFATGHVLVGAVLFSGVVCGAVYARSALEVPA